MPVMDHFRNPPIEYRLVPFWFWNGDMNKEEIVHQIQQMAEKGVGGFYISARQGLEVPYLSNEWFERVAVAIEAAQLYGLHAWLYDEYPYPSGMSGGEVILQHPDAKQRILLHQGENVNGPTLFTCKLPWAKVLSAQAVPVEEETNQGQWSQAIDITHYIGNGPAESIFQATGLTAYTNKRFFTARLQKQLIWQVPPGRWLISIFLEKEIEDFKYYGTYVDPCHKEAIQTFLATTHEQYALRFRDHLGQTIKGMFTDEVGLLGRIPWSPRLPAYFREQYGYELIEKLPALLYPMGEQTAKIRYQFFQSVHLLLNEAYHKPVRDWCDRHHMQYITEVQSTRITTQRYSHIPGGDSAHEKIGRSLEWKLDHYSHNIRSNPKFVSSIARQLGRERAAIECFHSVGWSMTLQDAKWMLDWMAGLGINFFVFHAFFYSISGLRKHDAPPSQFLQNPYWDNFRQLADYAARLSYALSRGRAETAIAIIHPTTSFWTHMGNPLHGFKYSGNDAAEARRLERLKQDWAYLCKELLLNQIDYDHLDPEMLMEASIEEGQISVGQARYKVLILPPVTNLEAGAWSQIKSFLQAGGKVISIGLLPYESIDQEQRIEAEAMAWFGVTDTPRHHYWQEDERETQGIEDEQRGTQQWIKGKNAAYFMSSAGELQHSHTLQHLLTLLEQCLPPSIAIEAVDGDRRSFLMQCRTTTNSTSLSESSRLIFITNQEGIEKTIRLKLAQRPTGERIERLDLSSANVITLPAEKTAHGWSTLLSFSAYESHLLRVSYSEKEPGSKEAIPEPVQQKRWKLTLDSEQTWKLTALQDNILRLGTFHFALDLDGTGKNKDWHEGKQSQAWPVVEAKPLIQQCADIATHQTFPLQFKQTFGLPIRITPSYPLHCWYQTTFHVEEIPSRCQLAMDEDAISGNYILYLNGTQITAQDFAPTTRYGYRQQACEVQQHLKQGNNHLTIHVEGQHDWDGVRDPLYLSGSFGVFSDATGRSILARAPASGMPQAGIQAGYPYYAGTLCFTCEVQLETLPQEETFELVVQGWQQVRDCVAILVNERSLGTCCWSPYHWEGKSALLRKGQNTIEIRVTNTLSGMLEGTSFDEQVHQIVPIDPSLNNSPFSPKWEREK